MSVIGTLITDRIRADADRVVELATKGWKAMTAAERNEWLSSEKGSYNAADLNRVGEAMFYVMDLLNAYGYSVTITPRTDWTMGEIPEPDELQHYLDDVATLRAILKLPPSTPAVPSDMDGLTFEEANDIERILLDIDRMLSNIAAAWFYSGEIYAGEFT